MAQIKNLIARWDAAWPSPMIISRQYDNCQFRIDLMNYPEPEYIVDEQTEQMEILSYYLIVWMKETEDGEYREMSPIMLPGPYWIVPNYYTQLVQDIRFQFCVQSDSTDYEAHSAIFTGRIVDSIEHDGTAIDVIPVEMFDAYKAYIQEIAMAAGAVVIDPNLDTTGAAADAKATGDMIAAAKPFVVQVPGSAAVYSGSITSGDFARALAAYTAGSGVYAVKDSEVYQLSAAGSATMTFTLMYHGTMNYIKQITITSADTFTVTNTALSSSAADTSYSNTASGLAATNVQAAIDESAAAMSNTNERLEHLEEGGLNIKDEVIEADVNAWLDEHPEATTTVQDGSLDYKKLVPGTLGSVIPQMFGAEGDGQTDDTNAFQSMLDKAQKVFIPNGRYVVTNLTLKADTIIDMDNNAVIIQKAASSTSEVLISLNEHSLIIQGGTIDGNVENKSVRPYMIAGSVLHEKKLILRDVTFYNISKYGVYMPTIGGHIVFDSCEFYETNWASGSQRAGTLVSAQAGEAGYPADVHILNCKAVSYCYNDLNMTSAPGGFFFSCRDDNGDLAHGNRSTVEAVGNYFEGFGLFNDTNNVIYAIHFYPLWSGVRIIGNRFIKCMHGAICIKSCEDTVISNNVILDALTHENVTPTLNYGMISYTPNHHGASGYSRKRAVISGNIVNGCGGTSDQKGCGITVMGDSANAPDSYCDGVVVSNNIINDGRRGIFIVFAQNIEVGGNAISNVSSGIVYQSVINLLNIHDNVITTVESEGSTTGLSAGDECPDLTLDAKNNLVNVLSAAGYGFNIRGGGTLTLIGNHVITVQNAMPYYVGRYGSSGANIKKLFWDNNVFESVNHPTLVLTGVDLIAGKFDHYNFSSDYSAEFGTIFVDYATKKMYILVSRTNHKAWREITLSQVS